MRNIRIGIRLLSAVLLAVPAGLASLHAGAVNAQLPAASPTTVATANNYTALARGFTAIGLNPAGLAMPSNPGFSLALAPIQLRSGLAPVTLADVARFSGEVIPSSTKEEWLQDITRAGALTGAGGADATFLALTIGPIGLQASTVGQVNTSLGPDAADLLLFGNAGRTGSAQSFDLAGTSVDGWAATTVALAFAVPLLESEHGSFALGVTAKYTMGHVLVLARDAGSLIGSEPLGIDLDLPSIGPGNDLGMNNGTGYGFDVGAAWENQNWALGASVQNVVNTFAWKLDGFTYRPGEAFFNGDDSSSDFDERAIGEAPSALRDEALAQGFEPAFAVGIAYHASSLLSVMAEARHDTGKALVVGERSHVGLGLELRPLGFLPLRGGVALVTDSGIQYGAGFGLVIGPLNISTGVLLERGGAGDVTVGSVGISFGHH